MNILSALFSLLRSFLEPSFANREMSSSLPMENSAFKVPDLVMADPLNPIIPFEGYVV